MEHTRISHYDVGRRLGRGGMGEVYEALDLDLDRRVALKFVAPELAAEADALKRFEREARAAAALSHPHIATLYAFERDGARTFIAMELVAGESVRDRIRRGPLPIADALAIARDTAGALALAHRRGIAHRDVKPENLMFDQDGVLKLMDFGLARAAHASRMTTTGSTLGTAAYMPPESVRGGAGAPGDVFALGVMLYEMLAGTLPFSGESPLAVMYAIANQDPAPLRAARPDAPEPVEALVRRMLEKDPERRPDAAAVARELAAITGAPLPIGASDTVDLPVERIPAALAAVPAVPDREVDAAARSLLARRTRNTLVFFGLLFGVAVFVGLIIVMGLSGRENQRRVAAAADALMLNNQGVAALQARNLVVARRFFTAALERVPDFAQAQINLARVEFGQGAPDSATRRLNELLRRQRGTSAEARQQRGYACSVLGDIAVADQNWTSAVRNFQQAFDEDSSEARAYNQLGWALLHAGLGAEARAVLARGQARFPTEKALHKNAALARLALGDLRGAEDDASQAIVLDPDYAAGHAAMARVHARLGRRSEALIEWQAFLRLPHDPADSLAAAAELARIGLAR